MIERELKYKVPDTEIFQRINEMDSFAGYEMLDHGAALHIDTYFDTTTLLLFHNKSVFRHRAKEKGSYLTFKTHKKPSENSDVYERIEIEERTDLTAADILEALPDSKPVHALFEHFDDSLQLEKSLTVTNNRHTYILIKDREPLYELVLDDVQFIGPRGVDMVNEIEVESLQNTGDGLTKIDSWVKEQLHIKQAGPSKYILGMKLVGRKNA